MNVQQGDIARAAASHIQEPTTPASIPSQCVVADHAHGQDRLGRDQASAFLAEVVAHAGVETPLCIGIFGPAGAGKSTFVESLLGAVARLGQAADDAGLATPFHGRIAVVRLAPERGVDPARAIVRQIGSDLAARYPRLVLEASHAGVDPRSAAREAGERLNDARQRLEVERRELDALSGRHASLGDTVLFDTPGSRIDAYARGNRGRIERAARGFGVAGTPLDAYKGAVREASEASGPAARWSGWLRAFWGYRGQGRLLLLALACLLAAWGVDALIVNEAKIFDALRSSGDRMGPLADGLQARWPWLASLKTLLELAAAAAVALNILRAARYLMPIHRGVSLLRADLETRRRELDGLVAHRARRLDAMSREAEQAGEHAAQAEKRLAGMGVAGAAAPSIATAGPVAEARAFVSALSQAAREPSGSEAPTRIVVAIDGLETVPAADAADLLRTARSLLRVPGFVTILAGERMHLAAGFGDADPATARAELDRLVQIPYDLGGADESWPDATRFARALLGTSEPDTDNTDPPDAATSVLDRPWSLAETATVEALAPFSGASPRAVKRFVNLYRVARADPRMHAAGTKDFAALALGLAVPSTGLSIEPWASADADTQDPRSRARRAVGATMGMPFGPRDGERGLEVARSYSAGP